MTNHGGEPSEPTSYELRPPQLPPPGVLRQAGPGPGEPAGAPAQDSYGTPGGGVPGGAQGQFGAPESGPAQGSYGPPSDRVPTQLASGPPSDGSGRVVGGRYELLSRLGHGGMGTVWRARDQVVQREVAVKEPRLPEHLSDAERHTAYQRMEREARAAARIDHPSVVTMHDVVVEDGKPWVVMELVRGQSLADRLKEGTLDARDAASIGLAVLGALQAAHEAGVLHRDVKPDNVLLGRDERVVLTDFGIAQVEGEAQLTETGAFVGSPEFIAPERVLGQRPGPASDLWSLGVVLYAAVEGMSPFRRSHTPATLQAVLSAEPASPSRAAGPLAMVTMQLLRKDPLARPGAAEVREGLKAVAAPVAPRPALPPAPRSSRWLPPALKESRRARYGTGGGALVVVIVLVLLFANPFSSEPTLPKGWETRPERETVDASLAVPSEPSEYLRTADADARSVTFSDPSGVFTVSLSETDNGELDDTDNPVAPTGKAWEKYYKSGGDLGSTYDKVHTDYHKTSHQNSTAWDFTADYTDSTDTSDYPLRHRAHLLIVPKDPSGKSKVYWKLEVDMPAEGWANEKGEELYAHVVDNLDIQGL